MKRYTPEEIERILHSRIPNFIGDLGTNETLAGNVPAPDNGDSEAKKFLSAAGGWLVPEAASVIVSGANLIQVYNVKDFGAIGTNTSNTFDNASATAFNAQYGVYGVTVEVGDQKDYGAIQAALYKAANDGTPVYIPRGIYRVNKTIRLDWTSTPIVGQPSRPKVTYMFGDGYQTQIIGYNIPADEAVVDFNGIDNGYAVVFQIENMRIAENVSCDATSYCLRVGDAKTGFLARRIWLEGANGCKLKIASSLTYAHGCTRFEQVFIRCNYGLSWATDNTAQMFALYCESAGAAGDNAHFDSCLFGGGCCRMLFNDQVFTNCQWYVNGARPSIYAYNIFLQGGNLNVVGGYFEEHNTAVYIAPQTREIQFANFLGCFFNGGSIGAQSQYGIQSYSSTYNVGRINVIGCSFSCASYAQKGMLWYGTKGTIQDCVYRGAIGQDVTTSFQNGAEVMIIDKGKIRTTNSTPGTVFLNHTGVADGFLGCSLTNASTGSGSRYGLAIATDTSTSSIYSFGSNYSAPSLRNAMRLDNSVGNVQIGVLGGSPTITVSTGSRALIGTVVDNGVDKLQITGTVRGSSTITSDETFVSNRTSIGGSGFQHNVSVVGAIGSYFANTSASTGGRYVLSIGSNAGTTGLVAFGSNYVVPSLQNAFSINNSTGTVQLGSTGSTALTISTGNRVLLGTTTDNGSDKLQVTGSVRATSNVTADGDVSVGDDLTVTDDATIGGILTLNNAVAGSASITNVANVSGSLGLYFQNTNAGAQGRYSLNVLSDTAQGILVAYSSAYTTPNLQSSVYLGNISGKLILGSAGAADVTVTTGHNVLVGTTTDDGSNKLQVNGSMTASRVAADRFTCVGLPTNAVLINSGSGVISGDSTFDYHSVGNQGLVLERNTTGQNFIPLSAFLYENTDTIRYPYFSLNRGRGTSASPSAVSNNDIVGGLLMAGYDGTGFTNMAGLVGTVEGVVSGGFVPVGLQFLTGTTSAITRMEISPLGVVTATGNFSSANLKRGTNSPEGVVLGNVGDLFQRTNGGPGTSLYIKQAGNGLTGWSAITPAASGDLTIDNAATVANISGGNVASAINVSGTKSFAAANFWTTGKTVNFKTRGYLSSVANPTLNMRVLYNGSLLCETGAVAQVGTPTNAGWTADVDITCRSVGASGIFAAQGMFFYGTNALPIASTIVTTLNTNVSGGLSLTATFGTSDPGNNITSTNSIASVL